ncbi:response regulator [Sulfuricurvum sp. IAE1]|uniref:response regulator transcription factor n=1 Tax=Sulfuricurvum sp. IAE1 TaxID=2546102 RepID=UPI001050B29D|nr:response regulator [Sulfuricurvum sp. IAE1]MDD3770884.1 response regulator [Sulfuricurvum sp.]MDX9966892.1 response regulator [Sulfuricurvum sp.]TDA63224.1 response regulator [Sulfuricurvum sp. IAE1]
MQSRHDLMKNLHILFVDDERLIREMVYDMLGDTVGNVSLAADGEEGLAFYRDSLRPVDIVISDQTMPVMNGLDMLEKIKQINPSQKCIMITAHSEAAYMLRAIEIGVEHFMIKPIIFDKLDTILYELALKIEQENYRAEKERTERRELVEHTFQFSFQTLVDNIPLPSLIVDENDTVQACNSELLSLVAGTEHYPKLLTKELDFKSLFFHDAMTKTSPSFCDWKEEHLYMGEDLAFEFEASHYRLKLKRMRTEGQKRFYILCMLDSGE